MADIYERRPLGGDYLLGASEPAWDSAEEIFCKLETAKLILGTNFYYATRNTHSPMERSLAWRLDEREKSNIAALEGQWMILEHPTEKGHSRIHYQCACKMNQLNANNFLQRTLLETASKFMLSTATPWLRQEAVKEAKKAGAATAGVAEAQAAAAARAAVVQQQAAAAPPAAGAAARVLGGGGGVAPLAYTEIVDNYVGGMADEAVAAADEAVAKATEYAAEVTDEVVKATQYAAEATDEVVAKARTLTDEALAAASDATAPAVAAVVKLQAESSAKLTAETLKLQAAAGQAESSAATYAAELSAAGESAVTAAAEELSVEAQSRTSRLLYGEGGKAWGLVLFPARLVGTAARFVSAAVRGGRGGGAEDVADESAEPAPTDA